MVDIANGLANLLNENDPEILAVVDYVPDFNLKELDEQKILIVPRDVEWENLTRGQVSRTYVLEIGIMQRLQNESEIAGFCEAVISLGDKIKNSKILNTKCVKIESIQLYNPLDFKQSKKAVGVLQARFKEL